LEREADYATETQVDICRCRECNWKSARIQDEIRSGNLVEVLTRFSDLILVSCIAAMIGMMIVPLPTWLLDILLTVNITIAVTI